MVDTLDPKQVMDPEIEKKDDARFKELKGKTDLSDDEKKELGEIKERHSFRVQKRIDKYAHDAKAALEKAEAAEKRAKEAEERAKRLELDRKPERVVVRQETIKIGDESYYTDEALMAMVENEELSEAEAYKHQRKRDKAELKWEIIQERDLESKKLEESRIRKEDSEAVLREYPHFDKGHPDFNPEDPLYKEASRIFRNGYASNPQGLSLALKDAKKILRMDDKKPDLSEDLNLDHSGVSHSRGPRTKEVTLSDYEQDQAVRQWTNIVNPKTQKPYSEAEAIEKAKKAKELRMAGRSR
ncbi:MAG TPA: hypothetical protein V6D12_14145 [Candidatus Obscuribacterales bacterium]